LIEALKYMKKFVFLISFMVVCMSNLIWGGDFEYYPGPFSSNSMSHRANLNSNSSNWYNSNMGQI
jgi:hypothetical protein